MLAANVQVKARTLSITRVYFLKGLTRAIRKNVNARYVIHASLCSSSQREDPDEEINHIAGAAAQNRYSLEE